MAQARILQGAATALAERGFDATVDDIAEAAGVGRRTVFRYFATHDEVVGAAVAEIMASYESSIPGPPSPGVELETWLKETALTMHDLNGRVMGRAFWDMNVARPGFPRKSETVDGSDMRRSWRVMRGILRAVRDGRRRGSWTPSLFSFRGLPPIFSPTTASRGRRG